MFWRCCALKTAFCAVTLSQLSSTATASDDSHRAFVHFGTIVDADDIIVRCSNELLLVARRNALENGLSAKRKKNRLATNDNGLRYLNDRARVLYNK